MSLKTWWRKQVDLYWRGPKIKPREPRDSDRNYRHLKYGEWCTVIQEFTDFDGKVHPAGETWIFRGTNFVPYEDGMSFYISPDGERTVHMRLQWRPEEQGEVLDHLERYVIRDNRPTD